MKIELRWLNCLWLILPMLVWNLILGSRINDPRISSDANSSSWLLISENIMRMAVFIYPLLLPLQMKDLWSKTGLVIYILGTLVYFASWLPLILAPQSVWSNSVVGLLAPRITPLIAFLGIALIGQSWPYGLIAIMFTFLHTWHGIQNL